MSNRPGLNLLVIFWVCAILYLLLIVGCTMAKSMATDKEAKHAYRKMIQADFAREGR